MIKLNT